MCAQKTSGKQVMPKPGNTTPMLATLAASATDEPGWLYEIKWDGYRALAFLDKGAVELRSRNNKPFNEKYYPVYQALQQWKVNAVVDGEIVVVDEEGYTDFSRLQEWRSEADGQLVYYLFDILWLNGKDLTTLPLMQRKKLLQQLMPVNNVVLRFSEGFVTDGTDFFDQARKLKLEGIMAKRTDSRYTPGIRTRDWLKIKTSNRQEVVIGGYTKNEGSSKPFSSLLVGVYEKGKLQYTGKIGTGFSIAQQQELMKQFASLEVKKSPFAVIPDVNKPSRFRPNPPKAAAVWLKPKLICEVSFREMTTDGVMRHPSFEGMREDKTPVQVTTEKPVKTRTAKPKTSTEKKTTRTASLKKALTPVAAKVRKTLLNPAEETQVRTINGHALKFTNLSKIYWPGEKITKRDLINYYYQMAPYIVPYIKDRPQSLNRFPNGIKGESFYQKDVSGKAPDWVPTFPYHSSDEPREKEYLVGENEATLLYMASLGCIEINPWSSRLRKPENPDWCIIDLDPDKTTFNEVIEAAQVTHEILEAAGIPGYCKTSGSTGLHIYIPLGAKYTYEQSREFGRIIARLVHDRLPDTTSIERATNRRKRKMYIDFLQNRSQATVAAPYSLRPKPGATVSMPLHWEEVKKGLTMKDFTIHNAVQRVREQGDIFKPVLGKGINMKTALAGLEKLFRE
ncbi:bifunctional non-homologous end joining protein LigD [Chitinophaga eiseniae]|uniref:DNA ligase (ATP) n=1 Tax=Chitinophaga eiseniae TaxID=634771 RepID=A0A1T4LX88_9BACT|nr:DNA ligase D [Chitinophaga eiseniae]SJZ59359.1 bifunctional non-homologous end joining protein LigD [Chitinophaga eiseniae]